MYWSQKVETYHFFQYRGSFILILYATDTEKHNQSFLTKNSPREHCVQKMIIEDVIDFMRKVPPFQFLDDSTLKDITSGIAMEFYPKGTFIQKQGGPAPEYLYIIKKGEVKVFIKNENEDTDVFNLKAVSIDKNFFPFIFLNRNQFIS